MSRRSEEAAGRRGSETSAPWKKTPVAKRQYDRKRELNPNEETVEGCGAFVQKEDKINYEAREEDKWKEPRKPTRVMGSIRTIFAQNLTMPLLRMENSTA